MLTIGSLPDEHPGDVAAIREVNRLAFGQDEESTLVDALRAGGAAMLSLVATLDGQVVGHILYSPVRVADVTGAALAPMAVLPAHQRRGIGSKLVRASIRRLEESGGWCERGAIGCWRAAGQLDEPFIG